MSWTLQDLAKIPFEVPIQADRSLDKEKCATYLSIVRAETPFIAGVLEAVIEKTQYIETEAFFQDLISSYKDCLAKLKGAAFYLLIDDSKVGSETWLVHFLAERILASPGYSGIVRRSTDLSTLNLKDEQLNLVVIDDAIYSGCHICSLFDQLTYNMETDKHLPFNIKRNIKPWLVVPVHCQFGVSGIEESLKSMDIPQRPSLHSAIRVDPIEIPYDKYKYGSKEYKVIVDGFEFGGDQLCPIYFDHKVAGDCSSFPTVYLKGRHVTGSKLSRCDFGTLLKALPDRTPIDRLAEKLSEK